MVISGKMTAEKNCILTNVQMYNIVFIYLTDLQCEHMRRRVCMYRLLGTVCVCVCLFPETNVCVLYEYLHVCLYVRQGEREEGE